VSSGISAVVFGDPSGRRHAGVALSGAVALSAPYAHRGLVGDSTPAGWLPLPTGGAVLSGVAESLPKERRRAAGALRVAAVLVVGSLLVVASAPGVVRVTR
jgi:hypothetical protein